MSEPGAASIENSRFVKTERLDAILGKHLDSDMPEMLEGDLPSLILTILFLFLSGFFSSSEAAFLSVQRTRMAHLISTGVPGAKRVLDMIENPDRLLSTILLGNNVVNVAFTALVTTFFINLLGEGQGLLAATVVGTIALLIIGEIVPKSIAVRRAESVSLIYARPLKFIEYMMLPIVVVLQFITSRISALLGGGPISRESITEGEFRTLIDIGEAEGTFEPVEAEMLENVFRFGDRQVREVMTPRPEIISLERGATLRAFLDTYSENSHTRFPVYKGELDNIIGIISSKDILKVMATRGINPEDSVTDVIRDAHFVPETKRVAELFIELRTSGNQMAFMVDEYGGLSGLVTLKRLSEEVVGAVGEEGEGPEEEYEAIDENTFQVEGGMSIDEANDELDLELPDGDFDTIAGFVLDVLGHIPTEGELIDYGALRLEITQMRNLKIESIKVTRSVAIESDTSVEPVSNPLHSTICGVTTYTVNTVNWPKMLLFSVLKINAVL